MVEIRPQAGPQEEFLSSQADVVFYGGAAGGGKTYAMLLEPLRHIQTTKGFGAVIFRRTSKQHTAEGGAWDESRNIYPHLGAMERSGYLDWHFPPFNNKITFAHMEHEKNRLDWKSSQIPLLIFDQLEDFTRRQFIYMLSRNRSACGIRPYVRGGYNPVPPDDATGGWIHEFVAWYLDENGEYPDPSKTGRIRWFVNMNDTLHWYDKRSDAVDDWPDARPKSFTFIPADVHDNKVLLERDPGYLSNLMALDFIDQERLLRSNHKIRAEAGKVYNREWFRVESAIPNAYDVLLRFWDFAATEQDIAKGAATSSALLGLLDGRIYVLDVTEDWIGPGQIDERVISLAQADGRQTIVRWEEEGGSSGKRISYHLARKLMGYNAAGVRPQGDKVARGKAFAAQAYAGNVSVARRGFTEGFLNHMHQVPTGSRLDIHDATVGAFNEIVLGDFTQVEQAPDQQPVIISAY